MSEHIKLHELIKIYFMSIISQSSNQWRNVIYKQFENISEVYCIAFRSYILYVLIPYVYTHTYV